MDFWRSSFETSYSMKSRAGVRRAKPLGFARGFGGPQAPNRGAFVASKFKTEKEYVTKISLFH